MIFSFILCFQGFGQNYTEMETAHGTNPTLNRIFDRTINSTIIRTINRTVIMITANELKIKGVKAIEDGLKDQPEVAISVRGKVKYVAMSVEQYEQMRVAELEVAYQQVMEDVREGRYTTSLDEHFKEIDSAIVNA